eukprot:TRINITY_DN22784_c0_g2_i1.p1 TRINITY_DN22784_c0_g2~~TRINITY_DN22784_c0_g2_i1.p1  ORF type:complete len:543 (-),score=97.94 TRINITY_DN22784_c0_g2_i1:140-1768(-)
MAAVDCGPVSPGGSPERVHNNFDAAGAKGYGPGQDFEERLARAEECCAAFAQALEEERAARHGEAAEFAARVARLEAQAKASEDRSEALAAQFREAFSDLAGQVESGFSASEAALRSRGESTEAALQSLVQRINESIQRGSIEVSEAALDGLVRRVDEALLRGAQASLESDGVGNGISRAADRRKSSAVTAAPPTPPVKPPPGPRHSASAPLMPVMPPSAVPAGVGPCVAGQGDRPSAAGAGCAAAASAACAAMAGRQQGTGPVTPPPALSPGVSGWQPQQGQGASQLGRLVPVTPQAGTTVQPPQSTQAPGRSAASGAGMRVASPTGWENTTSPRVSGGAPRVLGAPQQGLQTPCQTTPRLSSRNQQRQPEGPPRQEPTTGAAAATTSPRILSPGRSQDPSAQIGNAVAKVLASSSRASLTDGRSLAGDNSVERIMPPTMGAYVNAPSPPRPGTAVPTGAAGRPLSGVPGGVCGSPPSLYRGGPRPAATAQGTAASPPFMAAGVPGVLRGGVSPRSPRLSPPTGQYTLGPVAGSPLQPAYR